MKINCKINLILTWLVNRVISGINRVTTFPKTDTKRSVNFINYLLCKTIVTVKNSF